MNYDNEPVAWINLDRFKDEALYLADCVSENKVDNMGITTPLYTHPVKEQKCVVKDCENHRNEGGFTGDLCNPCYRFIANGEGVYSQAYRNVNPAKTLTDEEIMKIGEESYIPQGLDKSRYTGFARAILRKAQEK
jgi:hypothetical protein